MKKKWADALALLWLGLVLAGTAVAFWHFVAAGWRGIGILLAILVFIAVTGWAITQTRDL